MLSGLSRATLGDVNVNIPESSQVVLFTSLERIGVTVMAIAGVTSCALVSLLLLYIAASAMAVSIQRASDRPDIFIRKQIAFGPDTEHFGYYASEMGDRKSHLRRSVMYDSRTCVGTEDLLAVTLVMGDLGSTVWSVVIAAHTFSGIAMNRHWPRWVMWTIVCTGWLLVIILSNCMSFLTRNAPLNLIPAFLIPLGIAATNKGPFCKFTSPIYIPCLILIEFIVSIAGTWCFISSEYAIPRLIIHYVPLFVASAIILILYCLIFLFLRGSIHFLPAEGPAFPLDDIHSRQRVAIAKRMLWYPIAYLTCILPISIIRILGFHLKNIPETAWIVGMFFLFALGSVDSVIYATTRTVIHPLNLSFRLSSFGKSSGVTSGTSTHESRSQGAQNFDYVSHSERVTEDGGDVQSSILVTQERIEGVV
ncbi:hypothetical protein K439DRAFT_1611481 [Ramaria rubella]|nr:hypothetical protein K439DRAFT_1611481 [Ramaria rubella]